MLMLLCCVFFCSCFGSEEVLERVWLEPKPYTACLPGAYDRVDIKEALEVLYERYEARTVLTDTGGTLSSVMLENGLVDRISLLISPLLIGKAPDRLFDRLRSPGAPIELKLLKMEIVAICLIPMM